jgi:ArsR family metal-binding transcriptional regulator
LNYFVAKVVSWGRALLREEKNTQEVPLLVNMSGRNSILLTMNNGRKTCEGILNIPAYSILNLKTGDLRSHQATRSRKYLETMGKFTAKDHLNCGACGYDTCVEHAIAIVKGLAENRDVSPVFH